MARKKNRIIRSEKVQLALRHAKNVLDFMAEKGNTILPLVVLVVGGTIISYLPGPSSQKLFESPAERESTLAKFGVTDFKTPIVIVSADCPTCSTFLTGLDGAHIPYLMAANTEGAGLAIIALASKRGTDSAPPLVLIGDDIVIADVATIKSMVAAQ